jgi:hypothetical protein
MPANKSAKAYTYQGGAGTRQENRQPRDVGQMVG